MCEEVEIIKQAQSYPQKIKTLEISWESVKQTYQICPNPLTPFSVIEREKIVLKPKIKIEYDS